MTGTAKRNALTPAELASRYHAAHRSHIESILEKGRVVALAKEQLPHGEFIPWVKSRLRISQSTAYRQKSIASDRWVLSHVNDLPGDEALLYSLSVLPESRRDALLAAGVIHPGMRRADLKLAAARERLDALGDAPELPEGRYAAILADPPWPFETWSEAGKDRSPDVEYPTMPIEKIAALPVGTLAAEDCMLFLWAQWWSVPDARGVIEAWGFRYATGGFVWFKEGNFGGGYYTRHDTEPCLLAVKGNPARLNADVRQSIHAPRGAHSAKPREAYDRIERLVAGPYLELFARGPARPGWTTWGNEAGPASSEKEAR